MLDKWHKKQKPVFTGIARGIGGFAFGHVTGGAGGGGTVAYTQNSGGVINDYEEAGGDKYRAHIFLHPGTFTVTDPTVTSVEYLVVAGGGGGGSDQGGGGGAGGMRTSYAGAPAPLKNPAFTVATNGGDGSGNYTVEVGHGGRGKGGTTAPTAGNVENKGGPSYFGPPSTPNGIAASGGGAGASYGSGQPGPVVDLVVVQQELLM